MSDIKLYRLGPIGAAELATQANPIEKSLQTLFEANLEALLGVRFLASEVSTGPTHGGRIDTLGLDEAGCPVIIEYKRAVNENVVSQVLYYLDWLMDHKGDFERLTHRTLGAEAAETIDWSQPRLLCIAGEFSRYDESAVKHTGRNIELLRYRRFDDELLMVERTRPPRAARSAQPPDEGAPPRRADPYHYQRIDHRVSAASAELRGLYDAVRATLLGLGDDVRERGLKSYTAFKRLRNFARLEIYPRAMAVVVYLRLDPSAHPLEPGFTRDVRRIGHYGTGHLEVSMKTPADLERARHLLRRAYEES
jgi:predicted transport protein